MIEPLQEGYLTEDFARNRELKGKINELVNAVNNLEVTVYGGEEEDGDVCPDCWAETEPFIANLPNLSGEQLLLLQDRAHDILDERLDNNDDGYCEQCNDYHDAPDDDDEGVTEDVQKVVDDMQGKNEPREIDTTDGLFSEFVAYVAAHPEQRFFQAVRNWSGYNFIFGSMAKSFDDYSQLEDTFNLKTKGPKKGSQS